MIQQDPWSAFPDAPEDEGDEWADFPDGEPSQSPSQPKPKKPARLIGNNAPVTLANPLATDGDTLRDGDTRLRLNGIDAPELNQPGFRPDGTEIALGELARDFMQNQIRYADDVRFKVNAPPSFGRNVGIAEADGNDIGLASLRAGQSFVAPEYIEDEEQRFQYAQAERLARMNRLGAHGVQTQTPAEFRADPNYVPKREKTGMMAHDKSPRQGMTAEQEQRVMHILRTGTLDELWDYSREIGWHFSMKTGANWFKQRDALKGDKRRAFINRGFTYGKTSAPNELIDPEDGQAGAALRQYGSEFLVGGLDELGAVVDMLGGTPDRENIWNSDRRWGDIWHNNIEQNQAILRHDQEEYPTTSTVAGVGGALTSAFVVPYGAGVRTASGLARVGAGWGGAYGFLGTDGDLADRTTGAIQNATVGAVVNPAIGKGLQAAAPVVQRGYQALRGRGNATIDAPTLPGLPGGGTYRPASMPMAAEQPFDPALFAELRQPRGIGPQGAAATRADLLGSASTVRPSDMLPLPGNIPDLEDAASINAGRFDPARATNESTALTSHSVLNWRGEHVPKRGPVDLVGFLRSKGGLQDDGGELAVMGITSNAARRGMDHVGQEARFGPMISDEGMTLDDAALYAWEAGYFPEHATRPDIDTFLNGLRDTYEGNYGRRFLPDDFAEVEGFTAMRAERLDVERQIAESDVPVLQDRSIPADNAPFPPVEAYDDWAGDAITRVGNIDVTKLDSPQDISRALKQTYGLAGGFDEATRGRITQAETEALAGDLNMTAEQLLSRRKGDAFNAEQALAARQILAKSGNELVNFAKRVSQLDDPGVELLTQFRQAWVRHVAIQEQVSGITAEAGRTLQQFKQAADSRAVRGDVLEAFKRAGGTNGDLKDAADLLLDAAETSPGQFNVIAQQANKPKLRDKLSEVWVNTLLSNPPTHVVNMVSNSITAAAQIPEYALASGIGGVRRAMVGEAAQERILASEVGARAVGMLQGTKDGLQLFAKALRTGEADDFISKVEGDQYKAISGVKGEIIRIPTRFLTAEDQIFKGIARRGQLTADAVRIANREGLKGQALNSRIADLVANPTDDMLERSRDYGLYLTFQSKLGPVGQNISNAAAQSFPIKLNIPFVRTPINLLKYATERSPAAPLLKEWRADFKAGGERRDLAIAKASLGSGIGLTFYTLAQQGLITGGYPPDNGKGRLLMADGWQPYSIKVGDRFISYSRLDPLSTTMGVAADMATLPENFTDRQRENMATMLTASIMNNLASKTWLSGVSALTAGLADPQRNAENWLERVFGSFTVPAGVAGVARQIDPVARQREGISEAIQARIPGMSDGLYPRRDIFGEPVELDSLGPDFISPFWQSKSKNDPVIAEMLRIGKNISAPGKQYTSGEERLDYSRDKYDRYHEIAGRFTYNNLLALIGSQPYAGMTDTQKRKAAKRAISKARENARGLLENPDYQMPEKGAGAFGSFEEYMASDDFAEFGDDADAFSDFPDADTAPNASAQDDEWGEFKDAPQRDVMGEISQAIPGVRFSSGYRNPLYQESMRNRGYSPAQNSAHLNGSALDLLPPPGMSMGELARLVSKAFPEMWVLNERDHVHIEVPDWQGAPAIGGARDAGIRNPVLGR